MNEGGGGALSSRVRVVIAAGLAGLLVGFLWGIADVPRYAASATVLVKGKDDAPAAGSELEAAAQRAASARVAERAAGLIGGDVGGADLLSDVTATADPSAGAVRITAEADAPDFAVAAANGYALALVDVGGKRFEEGAAATIPGAPSENRSALLWSLLGLLAGLLVGALAVGLRARSQSAAARSGSPAPTSVAPAQLPEQAPGSNRTAEPEAAAEAFGAPLLARFADPAALIALEDGALAVDRSAARPLTAELGVGSEGGPRLIAAVDVADGGGALEVLIALAVSAAERGSRPILVEADIDSPALAERIGVRSDPGLREYLSGAAGPRDVLRSVPVRGGGGGGELVCVPAGRRGAALPREPAEERFAALLERLPRVYDLVLVAAPAASADRIDSIVALVDGVILVSADDDGAGLRIAAARERLAGGRVLAGALTAQSRRHSAAGPPSGASR